MSYLQKNCQNQNCKTFPTLPVHKLVSLFSCRPTCVRTYNHGYELSFQTTPLHTHPFSFLPCPHGHVLALCSSAHGQTDCPCTLTGGKQRASRASPCPASCCHPRRLREEAPANPQLLLATRVLLTPWLWTHPLQSCDSPPALQGWSRSPRAFRGLWLWLCAPGDSLGGHQMNQILSTEKLCQPCANGRPRRKEVLLLHFFMVISAESKKRAPGLEGGKLKSLDK